MKNFDKPLYIKLYNKILENIENEDSNGDPGKI